MVDVVSDNVSDYTADALTQPIADGETAFANQGSQWVSDLRSINSAFQGSTAIAALAVNGTITCDNAGVVLQMTSAGGYIRSDKGSDDHAPFFQCFSNSQLTWALWNRNDESFRLGRYIAGAFQDWSIVVDNTTGDVELANDLEIGGDVGFYGTTPVAQSAAYSVSNAVTDRTYNADATSTAELADVLATLIADLQATGLIG